MVSVIAEPDSTLPAMENNSGILSTAQPCFTTVGIDADSSITHPALWSVSPIGGGGNYSEISEIHLIGDGDTIRVWGAEGHTYEDDITIRNSNVIIEQWEGSPVRPLITAKTDGTSTLTIQTVDNVTLRGLDISNNHHSPNRGGGVYVRDATLTIEDSIIDNNTASLRGGGVYVSEGGALTIRDTAIHNNTATDYGGGVCAESATLTIENAIVNNNTANYGGGVYVQDATATIENTNIHNNTASEFGAGVYGNNARLTIGNTTLSNNTASSRGGGVYVFQDSTLAIRDTIIRDNTANYGGGVDARSATLTIENVTMHHNTGQGSGGGVYASSAPLTIRDATIYNNTATTGGGVYANSATSTIEKTAISNNTALSNGGGVSVSGGLLAIGNTTIHDNTADYGGGVSVSDGTLTIGDTTIHDNTADYGGGVYAYDSRLTLRNNLFSNEKNFDAYTRSSYVWDAVFNQTLLLKDNIAGGPYCGGNVWASPAGTGFSETARDANFDGICDENITFTEMSLSATPPVVGTDELPLVYNRSRGTLTIETDPAGAILFVDKRDINRTTDAPAALYLPTGTHTILAKKDNLVNTTGVSVSAGEKRALALTLEEAQIIPVISASPGQGLTPLRVVFNGSATGNIEADTWNWTFYDGKATSRNTTHTFSQVGIYSVVLNATNTITGFSNETSRNITVLMPEPVLALSPDAGEAPLSVALNVSCRDEPTAWNLSLGDGRWINATSSNGINSTISYPQAGEYTLILNVSANGCSNETSQAITVSMPEPGLSVSPVCGLAPLDVRIEAAASGQPTAWNLSLGDGNWINATRSDDLNRTVTYPQAGDYTLTLNVSANGCSNETSQAITVSMPEPGLSISPDHGSAPLDVIIQASSNGGQPTAWNLSLGDGRWINATRSDDLNRMVTYPQAGDYILTLNVSANGCSNETSQAITVSMPEPGLSVSPDHGSAPLDVRIEAAASGQPTAWNLSLGDGRWINETRSDDLNRTVTYQQAGNYTLTLNVSANGYYNETSQAVMVSMPEPVLSVSPVCGLAPLDVRIEAAASGQPTAWNLSLGDGNWINATHSDDLNRTVTYPQAGEYTLTLNVSASGYSNETSQEIMVSMPEPALSVSPVRGSAPLDVIIQASSHGGQPIVWNLSLGDGRWINATRSDDLNRTVTYPQAGYYTLTLNVSANGCSNETSQAITVLMPEPALSVSPDHGSAPLDVIIQAFSSGGQPTAWNLSLGDGRWINATRSDDLNRTVTYPQAGDYILTLNVSANGCSNETSQAITVSMPEPGLSVSPVCGLAPLDVRIEAAASGQPTAWNLSLGDGRWINATRSNDLNRTVTYQQAGDYTLTLNVSANGYYNETSQEIMVLMPEPALSVSPDHGSAPLDVRIEAVASGQPSAWNLSLGDGRWINTTRSDDLNRTVTYQQAGDYTLTLNVSANGYYNETSQGIAVSMPEPNISLSPQTGIAPLDVRMEVYSSGQPTTWNFSFGNGTWINATSPDEINRMITYPEVGDYTLTLNVSANGYYNETSEVITVLPPIPSPGSGSASHTGIGSVSHLKAGDRTSMTFKNTAVTKAMILPAADISDLMITIEKKSGPENGILPPDAPIYQYDLVHLYKADASDIAEITYTFSIPKDWLTERNAIPSLWWYNATAGEWTEYSAEITGDDARIVIAGATCPGIGWIALGGVSGDTPVAGEQTTPDSPLTPGDSGSVSTTEEPTPMPEETTTPVGYAGILMGLGAAALIRQKTR
ncbi:hypothetical protein JCM10550A_23840 [Methanogenium cariaci]